MLCTIYTLKKQKLEGAQGLFRKPEKAGARIDSNASFEPYDFITEYLCKSSYLLML